MGNYGELLINQEFPAAKLNGNWIDLFTDGSSNWFYLDNEVFSANASPHPPTATAISVSDTANSLG
jgi:hypothetical protein